MFITFHLYYVFILKVSRKLPVVDFACGVDHTLLHVVTPSNSKSKSGLFITGGGAKRLVLSLCTYSLQLQNEASLLGFLFLIQIEILTVKMLL